MNKAVVLCNICIWFIVSCSNSISEGGGTFNSLLAVRNSASPNAQSDSLDTLSQSAFILSSDSIIVWGSKQLMSSDFLGTPPMESEYNAITWTDIRVSQTCLTPDTICLIVQCNFLRDKSWFNGDSASFELISHERVHFDISEYATRILRRKLSHHQSKSIEQTSEYVKMAYQQIKQIETELTEQFDRETNHGTDYDNQQEWVDIINKKLDSESRFQNKYIYVIRLKQDVFKNTK